jgi:hypothetical protein
MTAHFKYLSSPQSLSLELEDILFSFSIKLRENDTPLFGPQLRELAKFGDHRTSPHV